MHLPGIHIKKPPEYPDCFLSINLSIGRDNCVCSDKSFEFFPSATYFIADGCLIAKDSLFLDINQGYTMAKYLPETSAKIAKTEANTPHLQGFQQGGIST